MTLKLLLFKLPLVLPPNMETRTLRNNYPNNGFGFDYSLGLKKTIRNT